VGEVREEALQQMLGRVYSMICIDNKSIQCMLDTDPTGEGVRQSLTVRCQPTTAQA
jgi:hypothetical protein